MLSDSNITLHTTDWARAIADDIDASSSSIIMSALSLLPPTAAGSGPWPRLWRTLAAAAARHVPVAIYLPAPQLAHPATRANARAAHSAHRLGITIHLIRGPRLLHAKTAVIDARITYIGSGNFTAAACGPNHEFYARISCPELAAETIAALQRIEMLT